MDSKPRGGLSSPARVEVRPRDPLLSVPIPSPQASRNRFCGGERHVSWCTRWYPPCRIWLIPFCHRQTASLSRRTARSTRTSVSTTVSVSSTHIKPVISEIQYFCHTTANFSSPQRLLLSQIGNVRALKLLAPKSSLIFLEGNIFPVFCFIFWRGWPREDTNIAFGRFDWPAAWSI